MGAHFLRPRRNMGCVNLQEYHKHMLFQAAHKPQQVYHLSVGDSQEDRHAFSPDTEPQRLR